MTFLRSAASTASPMFAPRPASDKLFFRLLYLRDDLDRDVASISELPAPTERRQLRLLMDQSACYVVPCRLTSFFISPSSFRKLNISAPSACGSSAGKPGRLPQRARGLPSIFCIAHGFVRPRWPATVVQALTAFDRVLDCDARADRVDDLLAFFTLV